MGKPVTRSVQMILIDEQNEKNGKNATKGETNDLMIRNYLSLINANLSAVEIRTKLWLRFFSNSSQTLSEAMIERNLLKTYNLFANRY